MPMSASGLQQTNDDDENLKKLNIHFTFILSKQAIKLNMKLLVTYAAL